MSTADRKCVKEILKKKHVKAETIEIFENAVYDMCVKICKIIGAKVKEEYSSLAYEKIGEFLERPKNVTEDEILQDIKKCVQGYDSVAFKQEKFDYNRFMDRSVQKPTPVKGAYFCKEKECKSDLFYIWSLQTRGGDEGMTHYRQCATCGKRGKQ